MTNVMTKTVEELQREADEAWSEVSAVQKRIELEYARHQRYIADLMIDKNEVTDKWLPLARELDAAKKKASHE